MYTPDAIGADTTSTSSRIETNPNMAGPDPTPSLVDLLRQDRPYLEEVLAAVAVAPVSASERTKESSLHG